MTSGVQEGTFPLSDVSLLQEATREIEALDEAAVIAAARAIWLRHGADAAWRYSRLLHPRDSVPALRIYRAADPRSLNEQTAGAMNGLRAGRPAPAGHE